ncbi:MAG: energy transducer TonB [Treponema sp.]|nr:energy transducer TonB [Treponema sp.]
MNSNLVRPLVFAAVTVLHITLILFAGVRAPSPAITAAPLAGVMRLADIQVWQAPPPPETPPPPAPHAAEEAGGPVLPVAALVSASAHSHDASGQFEYLRRHEVSVLPLLPEDEIIRSIVYPPLARRLNIEGTVYLELFVDRHGAISEARILRETPANRGFGEAALNALRGVRAIRPAELNGVPVAARFQYSVRFTLR